MLTLAGGASAGSVRAPPPRGLGCLGGSANLPYTSMVAECKIYSYWSLAQREMKSIK